MACKPEHVGLSGVFPRVKLVWLGVGGLFGWHGQFMSSDNWARCRVWRSQESELQLTKGFRLAAFGR